MTASRSSTVIGRPAAQRGEAAIIMIKSAKSSRMVSFLVNEGVLGIGLQTPGIAFLSGRMSTSRTKAMPSASSEQSSQNEE